ncbi:4Fe-4S binding protein [uncultured Clostridium sp.]|uniref:4Fe-4S binding protein n=1 Tax=uncultured Clostridium sp. TaxID=59620 RepID=UPI0025FEB520|nr:4Fe-4S binding protein [uncultured Clostridium sp.]
MNSNVVIICESFYHSNTFKIAKAMSQKLNCRILTPEEAEKDDLSKYNLIGLGSGIYFTSFHPKIFSIVDKIASSQAVFIFSTHGAPFLGRYHNSIKEKLKSKNILIAGEFSCRGYDCTGPFNIIGGGNKGKPNESDERHAQKFIARLFPQFCKDTDTVINGSFIEVRADECIGCSKCVNICPMKVFSIKDNKSVVVDEDNCIHCSLCKNNCPNSAISIHHSWKDAINIAKKHAKKTSL